MHDIGWAVAQLMQGKKVARKGWNGKGMYLKLREPGEDGLITLPYVYMKTAQDETVPWLCSQTDLLHMDWEIVD